MTRESIIDLIGNLIVDDKAQLLMCYERLYKTTYDSRHVSIKTISTTEHISYFGIDCGEFPIKYTENPQLQIYINNMSISVGGRKTGEWHHHNGETQLNFKLFDLIPISKMVNTTVYYTDLVYTINIEHNLIGKKEFVIDKTVFDNFIKLHTGTIEKEKPVLPDLIEEELNLLIKKYENS